MMSATEAPDPLLRPHGHFHFPCLGLVDLLLIASSTFCFSDSTDEVHTCSTIVFLLIMRLFFALLTLAWIAFGLHQRLTSRQKPSAPASDLPVHRPLSSKSDKDSSDEWSGGFFYMSYSTRHFNLWPRSLLHGLPRVFLSKPTIKSFYDIGVALFAISMCFSLGVLVHTTLLIFWPSSEPFEFQAAEGVQGPLYKRDYAQVGGHHAASNTGNGALSLMIPGLTTPLSFLPSFLLAMVVSGAFHELGHALPPAL